MTSSSPRPRRRPTAEARLNKFITDTVATSPSNNDIDGAVKTLISSIGTARGTFTEWEARRGIAALLKSTGIHAQSVNCLNGLTIEDREDLAEAVFDVIEDRIVNNKNGKGFLLTHGASASACGWMRAYCEKVVKSEFRKWQTARRHNGSSYDPNAHEFTSGTPRTAAVISYTSVESRTEAEDRVDQYQTLTSGMRDADRRVTNHWFALKMFDVRPAVRPIRHTEREPLLAMLLADDTLAHRSVRLYQDIVEGSDTTVARCPIDDRILALWDDQDSDQIQTLIEGPKNLAHTLAVFACSPLPRPTSAVIDKILSGVRANKKSRSQRWLGLTAGLVDSWVASQFDAINEYAPPSKRVPMLVAAHTIHRQRLETLATQMSNFDGYPLGATPDQVLERLREITEPLLRSEFEQKVAAAERKHLASVAQMKRENRRKVVA